MWRFRQTERQPSIEGDEDQQFHDQGGLRIIAYSEQSYTDAERSMCLALSRTLSKIKGENHGNPQGDKSCR
jgi:hypothetical protein